MPKQSWLTRFIYGKSYGIVAINEKMKAYIEQRHGLKNVVNIYNPTNSEYIQERLQENNPEIEYTYILAVGRIDEVKQFDKLIKAYADSVLPGNNIKLMILGEGNKKNELKRYADNLNLSDKVVFMGFQENPYVYMKKALFVVLSSKFEGTPNVILESLACGTPVVSFDCFTGPSEIINDRENGLLIENQNIEKLTEGINLMFRDKKLYDHCKENATESIEKFSLETIGKQWLQYLKIDN
ncbi:4-alpha-N-acetylgalactosaminyltransferase [compost metagenome]